MALVYRGKSRIWQGSNTATTGGTITLTVAALPGTFNFRDLFVNGATVPLYLFDDTSGLYEYSYGILTYGGSGPTSDTISSRVVTFSSTGTTVAFGAGTRNAVCAVAAESFLLTENALQELTAPQIVTARGHLGLGTAAVLNAGTAVGNLVQLITGTPAKLPAVDGSNLVGLPANPIPAGTVTDFYQAAAPSGWTRVTSINDKVPVIVSAGSPGTASAGTWPITGLSADAVALTTAHLPSHTHGMLYNISVSVQSGTGLTGVTSLGSGGSTATSNATGTGDPHAHTVTGDGSWRPPAAYFLLASKN